MEKLLFDDGILRLDVNGNGLLCFNPSDFNLYQRFCEFSRRLPEYEKAYKKEYEDALLDGKVETEFEAAERELNRAKEIDARIKKELSDVFGAQNDFDKLLGGVNLMSFGKNGQRVITNLLDALAPYIEKGVKSYMKNEAGDAVSAAKKARAKRSGNA